MSNNNIKNSFQIFSANVRGLGFFNKSKFRLSSVNYKLKELSAASKFIPSIFVCTETRLKSFHKKIRLPRGCRYGGETSGDDGKGGIFVYFDNTYSIKDRKNDVKTIVSKYAMFIRVYVGDQFINMLPVYLLSCKNQELVEILERISTFILEHNISEFSIFGDLNIDFKKPRHKSRALILKQFLIRHNLFNLAENLNIDPIYVYLAR